MKTDLFLLRPLSLACRWLLSWCVPTFFCAQLPGSFLCVQISSSCKDTSQLARAPPCIHSCRAPPPPLVFFPHKLSRVSFCYLQEKKNKLLVIKTTLIKFLDNLNLYMALLLPLSINLIRVMSTENGNIFAELKSFPDWGTRMDGGDLTMYGYFFLQLRIN